MFALSFIDIGPIITAVSGLLITWFLNHFVVSDSFLRGTFQARIEHRRDLIIIHILNRYDAPIHIYGCFLSRSERKRFTCAKNFVIGPREERPLGIPMNDLTAFGDRCRSDLGLKDDDLPLKIILDTSQGRYYSGWFLWRRIFDERRLMPYYGHKLTYYPIRRRPAKFNMDLFLMVYLMASDLIVLLYSSDPLLEFEHLDTAVVLLSALNTLLLIYHSGYGTEKRRYAVYSSFLALLPCIIFCAFDDDYEMLFVSLFISLITFTFIYAASGWDMNPNTDGHYYLYDPYDDEVLEKKLRNDRDSGGIWAQF